MAAHHLTIAKAAFAAACLRPDITQLSRADLADFHSCFETAILRCSPSNVQTCKQWVLSNIAPSSQRSGALGKYLASFSKHANFGDKDNNAKGISPSRQRLHALYILNDVLHHAKYHDIPAAALVRFTEGLRPHILELFKNATSESKTKIKSRLEKLLRIWEDQRYFSLELLAKVREGSSDNSGNYIAAIAVDGRAAVKELPFIMPPTHGDPSAPYYDLPAANLMPHIVANSSEPMRPDQIRALQLPAGPADESLVHAVKDFLRDIKTVDDPFASFEDEGTIVDVDELGQISYRNETDEVVGDTYYGWSKGFCEKMKKRGKEDATKRSRRSGSRSSTRSRSMTPTKRRRYSSSSYGSRSLDRGRMQASYSPEPVRVRLGSDEAYDKHQQYNNQRRSPTSQVRYAGITQPPFSLQMAHHGFPVPPRPADWQGPWPPPPPPPPFLGAAGFPNMQFPPPPPPPHSF